MRRSKVGNSKKAAKDMPVRHGYYAASLALLTIASTFLMIPVIWLLSFHDLSTGSGYGILVVCALFLSSLFSEAVKGIYHREKKELLAGMLLPLPASLLLTFFLELSLSANIQISIHAPVIAGLAYFVAFNTRFIIQHYKHKKHKHYLGLYFIIPALLVSVSFLADEYSAKFPDPMQSEIVQSFADEPTAIVRNHVESCVSQLAEDMKEKTTLTVLTPDDLRGFEGKTAEYIESNLVSCINLNILAKDGAALEFGPPKADVTVQGTDLSITLYMGTKIIKGDTITQISDYFIIVR